MPPSNRTAIDSPLLVGLDMGSTNIKAVVYTPEGRTVALASVPSVTHFPRPTWAFYEPAELWSLARTVLREATAKLDDPRRIAGIAVTSVGEAGVTLDAHGEPTYDAIAWFDRRTIPQMDRLAREVGEDRFFEITGLSVQSIWSLFKLAWIKENEPEAFARTARWLMVADYLAFKLSGEAATDWSLASRTIAFDIRQRAWSRELLSAAGIPFELMAPPVASGTKIGEVTPAAAAETGLPAGCAVAAGGQDHVSGALAAGVVRRGQMLDSIGTAEAIFIPLDDPLADPELGRQGYTQGAHVARGKYYVFGGLYTAGASVDWLRHVIEHDAARATLLEDAARAPVGSLGVTFMPHLRLANAPHADSRSRATFVGITSDVDRGAMARAVLEGLAYEARSSLEPLLKFAGLANHPDIVAIGGGSKNDLLLQIKASVFGATMRVLDLDEATALGAAILAGIGAGVYRDVDDALATVKSHPREVKPEPEAAAFYDRYFVQVYQHLYAALKPVNHAIHELLIGDEEPHE